MDADARHARRVAGRVQPLVDDGGAVLRLARLAGEHPALLSRRTSELPALQCRHQLRAHRDGARAGLRLRLVDARLRLLGPAPLRPRHAAPDVQLAGGEVDVGPRQADSALRSWTALRELTEGDAHEFHLALSEELGREMTAAELWALLGLTPQ